MAETTKPEVTKGNVTSANDRMAAARAGRKGGRSSSENLSEREKFALRQMQGARSAIQKAQKGLSQGYPVPADLIDACAKINAAVGRMLFD